MDTLCVDCGWDTLSPAPGALTEYYDVKSWVWSAAGMTTHGGMLCIGCLERRFGRQLNRGDFTSAPINDPNVKPGRRAWTWQTPRLKDRLTAPVMSGRRAPRDYRWWNVRPGTAVTPPRLAHHAHYEPPVPSAPLVARCGFTFGPEDTVKRPARPYPRCPHCEHLATAAADRRLSADYATYRQGYNNGRLGALWAAEAEAES